MAEEEESGNPSSSYGESFLLPGPSQGNDGSQFGVPPSLAYLQGYEPDDSASLGMFAGGEPSQPGYAVDSVFPTSQPLDDTLSYHPDGVRGSRPILPRKDSTRSSGCSRTSNKSGQNNSTDAMISRVMSRFQSYDDLSKKKHKTWEEKEVRKILGNRRKAGIHYNREGETMKQLKSKNSELSSMLKDRDDTIETLSKIREEQNHQVAVKAERIRRLETQLSAMESLVQATEESGTEVYGERQ